MINMDVVRATPQGSGGYNLSGVDPAPGHQEDPAPGFGVLRVLLLKVPIF